MSQENITDKIIDYLYDVDYDDFDDLSVDRAKERLIDSFGVMAIGRTSPDTDATVALLHGIGGVEESTVATYGIKLPMAQAAFANSLIMRSYDFEAIDAEPVVEGDPSTAAHISGTTVPAALAVAECQGASGRDFLRALILADDVTTRVLNASGFTVHDIFDGNGAANIFGSTVASGLLMNLGKEEMKGAFSLGLNQMSGTMQNVFEKKITFKLPIALSARAGVFAAQLARCGYGTCLDDPIAGPRGYFDLFFSRPTPEKMLHRLGERYYADCVIKPWPACRATHGSINVALDAMDGRTLTADEVLSVTVHVPEGVRSFVGQGFKFGMNESYQGAFSIDFLVATAILRGDVRPEFQSPAMMTDSELGKLLKKVVVVGDLPPEGGTNAASIEICLANGEVLSASRDIALGDVYRTRLSREEILRKYYANIEFGGAVDRVQAERIVEMVNDLENLDDISVLMRLIA